MPGVYTHTGSWLLIGLKISLPWWTNASSWFKDLEIHWISRFESIRIVIWMVWIIWTIVVIRCSNGTGIKKSLLIYHKNQRNLFVGKGATRSSHGFRSLQHVVLISRRQNQRSFESATKIPQVAYDSTVGGTEWGFCVWYCAFGCGILSMS